MPTNTGLAAQIAIAEETTYGTIVPPTRGIEFVNEKIVPAIVKIYGKSLRSIRFQRKDRTRTYVTGAGGTITTDVLTKGFGILFKYMLGHVVSTQPDSVLKPTEYLHTFTQDDTGIMGTSLTMQVGRPATTGVIEPHTFAGCKITDWTLKTSVQNPLELDLTIDAKSEDLVTALAASPTYPTNAEVLTFIDGVVTVGGSAIYCTAVDLTAKAGLDVSRLGLNLVKRAPVANAEWALTGTFNGEYDDNTFHADMLAGTTASMVLTFSYGEIDAGKANPYQVVITLPNIEITGDPATVSGPGILMQNIKFKALETDTDTFITIAYHTTDVTP